MLFVPRAIESQDLKQVNYQKIFCDRSRNGNKTTNIDREVKHQANGEIVFVFVTERDDRVCPICRELETEVWRSGDPNLPDPPIHPNCRCSLRLAEIGF